MTLVEDIIEELDELSICFGLEEDKFEHLEVSRETARLLLKETYGFVLPIEFSRMISAISLATEETLSYT